jgi:hypothetical protein
MSINREGDVDWKKGMGRGELFKIAFLLGRLCNVHSSGIYSEDNVKRRKAVLRARSWGAESSGQISHGVSDPGL